MKQHLFLSTFAALVLVSFSYAQNTSPLGAIGSGTTTLNNSAQPKAKLTTRAALVTGLTPSATAATSANTNLNNLTTTAINLDLLPGVTATRNLGSSTLAWKDIYLRGDVYLDGTRFVSNAPGTASFNAFVGSNSGKAITTGLYNTAVGNNAMLGTTTGVENIAVGANTLYTNTSGSYNTAVGRGSLYYNTDGYYNTAIGWKALNVNKDGYYNTAIGWQALFNNTTYYNTGIGGNALNANTSGQENTANGYGALQNNTTGGINTGDGAFSLLTNKTGSGNSALGYGADVSSSALFNATAIGYQSVATASNQVMLGNTDVTAVLAAGSFVVYSDGRFKKNIQQNVPGLEFINQLKPVTYNYDIHGLDKHIAGNNIANNSVANSPAGSLHEAAITSKEKKVYTGFIAQDVEAVAKKMNFDFSGVYKPSGENDVYGLSYSDFVIPLVKAVQELDSKVNEENKKLEEENKELKDELASLKQMVMDMKNGTPNNTLSGSSSYLEQNTPNPSTTGTIIRYHAPLTASSVNITVTNIKGQLMKSINCNSNGTGQVTLDSAAWAAGTYNYTLLVDGKQADTKRLVIAR